MFCAFLNNKHTSLKAKLLFSGFVRIVATSVAVASLVGCGGTDGSHFISGTLTGLTTSGLVLANGSDTIALSSGATIFRLPTKVASGTAYSVTVKEQPTNRDQVCNVSNGSGYVIGNDITTVIVSCRATQWNVSTFAGTGVFGSANGSANSASFGNPLGVAVDGAGVVYVADSSNNRIRKIAVDGTVSTLAGSGASGSADDSGTNATFNAPAGVATDASGNVYVTDSSNFKVRVISPTGAVKTLAGSGSAGSSDGLVSEASFGFLGDLTLDSSGNIYVADWGNSMIRKITPEGMVTTIAGTGNTGSTDGPVSSATFYAPRGIAIDTAGNLYVADSGNNKVRKIDTKGDVSTLAGSGVSTFADGLGVAASFANPYSVAVDTHGNVFVVDTFNVRLRKITADGFVTTVAGSGTFGSADGIGTASSFSQPTSIATNESGKIYLAESGNCKIRGVRSQ